MALLPAPIAPFVGRTRELTDLRALLEGGTRLLTLVGPGGIGKSRLGVELVRHEADARFVALEATEPALVTSAVLRQLGISERADLPHAETLAASFGAQALVLVLDGCETVTAEVASLTEHVLVACPGVRVIASSREALGVVGETVWSVPALAEAPELFARRAAAARPDFDHEQYASTVERICDALDRLPLAIELAAAQLRVQTAGEILAALDDTLVVLDGDPRAALPRTRTIRAAIRSSHDRLSADLQRVFRRLSVFSGAFDGDAASAVADVDVSVVHGLVERSLLDAHTDGPSTTFRMLRTVRAFAHEHLVASGELDDARAALLYHVVTSLVALAGGDHPANIATIRRWSDQIDDALANADVDPDAGLALVGALWGDWLLTGQLARGRRWAERVLALDADCSPVRRASALHTLAWMAEMQGDLLVAHGAAVEGLRLAEDAPAALRARLLLKVAWPEQFWDRDRAIERFHEVLATAAPGDAITRSCAHFFLATALQERDLRTAEAHVEEAVRLAIAGNPMLLPHLDVCRAFFACLRGELDRGIFLADASAAASRTRGDTYWWIASSMVAAMARIQKGELDHAIATLTERLRDADELGQPWLSYGLLAALAHARMVAGDLDGTRAVLDRAAAAADTTGVMSEAKVRVLATEATLALASGDAVTADAIAREAVAAMAASGGVLPYPGDPEVVAAHAARVVGDWERAMRLAASAVTRVRDLGVRIGAPEALEVVADLLDDAGETARAARLAATAAALRAEMGLRPSGQQSVDAEPMSLDRAIADALRGRGPRGRPRAGWAALTPAERDVVDLVAEGLSNPEIAVRLYISRRTVSTHVSRIFTKLGVRSRAELAAARVRHLSDDPAR